MTPLIIIMGVAGCGKTTIGQALAKHLDCPFYDADDFHPAENVNKMANGVPSDDSDRAPWLTTLAALMTAHGAKGETAVIDWEDAEAGDPLRDLGKSRSEIV